MSERMRRRLEAVETKTGALAPRVITLWKPDDLDDAAYAAWQAAEVALAKRVGARLVIYSFLPWPPRSGLDVSNLLRSSSVASSAAELAAKVRLLPAYPEQGAVLAELEMQTTAVSGLTRQ